MPQNSFSVGRDVSLSVTGPSGPIVMSLVTAFEAKPDIIDKKVKGLDGITRHVRFPDGWQGHFEIERQDATLDDYWATLEANYYAGLNELPVTITETITEVSGAISQYMFQQVLLKLVEAGSWKGDETVKQRVEFVAARRVKL